MRQTLSDYGLPAWQVLPSTRSAAGGNWGLQLLRTASDIESTIRGPDALWCELVLKGPFRNCNGILAKCRRGRTQFGRRVAVGGLVGRVIGIRTQPLRSNNVASIASSPAMWV